MSEREKIIDALMGLLAEKPIERVGLSEIASRAGVSLAQLRDEFGSVLGIVAAHMKQTDRKVLAGGEDVKEEPVRERLFDVLMRRLEVLAPRKAAIRSLARSAARSPSLAFALNGLAVRSSRWMLTAAGIDTPGPKGMIRAQGLALLFGCVLQVWFEDDDPGLAPTMAALDRELSRGARWSGFLDDLCCIPQALCRTRRWRARRHRDEAGEGAAA